MSIAHDSSYVATRRPAPPRPRKPSPQPVPPASGVLAANSTDAPAIASAARSPLVRALSRARDVFIRAADIAVASGVPAARVDVAADRVGRTRRGMTVEAWLAVFHAEHHVWLADRRTRRADRRASAANVGRA